MEINNIPSPSIIPSYTGLMAILFDLVIISFCVGFYIHSKYIRNFMTPKEWIQHWIYLWKSGK